MRGGPAGASPLCLTTLRCSGIAGRSRGTVADGAIPLNSSFGNSRAFWWITLDRGVWRRIIRLRPEGCTEGRRESGWGRAQMLKERDTVIDRARRKTTLGVTQFTSFVH